MTESAESKNPYVGARSFRTGEVIYGRDRELNELVNLLIAERIILLHSPSGAGKSSLVNAGLIPMLVKNGFQPLQVGRVNHIAAPELQAVTGFNAYAFSLMTYWEDGLPKGSRLPPEQLAGLTLAKYLKDYHERAQKTQAKKAENDDDDGGLQASVLIFDQFEEILTLTPTDLAGKRAFFAQVGEALRDRSRWALFSMRDDYVASLDPYLREVPTRLANTFRLDLLGVEAARQAIAMPAASRGVTFDEAAVTSLINDLRQVQVQLADGTLKNEDGLYVEPVQLQVVCFRLWQTLKKGATRITPGDLEKIGDVDKSLRDYYNDRVEEASKSSGVPEREIREWVSHELITESGIRGQVLMGVEASNGLDNAAINVLVDAHLVRSENRRGLNWYELAHDRLLGPVKDSNEEFFHNRLNLLQRQASLWQRNKRADHFQLRADALEQAVEWAKTHKSEMSTLDREFLDACLETRKHEEEKLEAARRLAEAERLRAEEAALSAKKLRSRFFMALVAALAAAVFAGMAFISGNQARRASQENLELAETNINLAEIAQFQSTIAIGNAKTAEARQAIAETAQAKALSAEATAQAERSLADDARLQAVDARATAEYNAQLAIQQANLARSRELAGLANGYVENESDLALLLGLEAFGKADTGGAMDALLRAVQRNLSRQVKRLDQRIPTQPISVFAMAASSDGRRLAWGGAQGLIRVWDFEVQNYWETFTEDGKDVTTLAFSPDGRFLVSGDVSAKIIFWDSISGAKQRVIRPQLTRINVVAFSPDGSKLAYGGEARGNEVNLFIKNLTNNSFAGYSVRPFKSPIRALAWSPDGRLMATSGTDRIIRIWDVESGKELRKFEGLDGNVNSLAFSPDGQSLVSGADDKAIPIDKNILFWDISLCNRPAEAGGINPWDDPLCTLQTPRPFVGQVDDINTLAFSPDGLILATGDSKGNTRLWDVRYGELMDQQPDRATAAITSVTFSQMADALMLGAGSLDRTIGLSNLQSTDRLFDATTRLEGEVLAIAARPDDSMVLVTSNDGELAAWESDPGGEITPGPALAWKSTLAALSADGGKIAVVQADADKGWIEIAGLDGQKSINIDSPSGANITITEQSDGTTITRTQTTSIDRVTSLAFSSDGSALVGGVCLQRDAVLDNCLASELYFWDAATGDLLDHYSGGNAGEVLSLAYNPAGTIVAIGGSDGAVYLQDVQQRRAVGLPLVGLGGPVTSLAFTHDGRRLAAGGANSLLLLWDIDSAQPIANPITGFETAIRSLVYLNDSQTVVTGGSTGLLAWWPQSTWFSLACKYAGRNLSQAEWEQFFKGEAYRLTCADWPAGQ